MTSEPAGDNNRPSASGRRPGEPDDAAAGDLHGVKESAHSELILSGDFQSPDQLLSADHLTDAEKLSVIDQWLEDVRAAKTSGAEFSSDAMRKLIASIEAAKERLT